MNMVNNESDLLLRIYKYLFEQYGPQGWWPLLDVEGSNPTSTGYLQNYHPGDYSYPQTQEQRFEICVGAILVQFTAWDNVEKALLKPHSFVPFAPQSLLKIEEGELKEAIRPAGLHNQKAERISMFSEFFMSLKNETPRREDLLRLKGIGKETADAMLLYAFKVPTFVVDTYTRKIFANLQMINEKSRYDEIKKFFEDNLKPDLVLCQEYHALIVEHGKRYYAGDSRECPLKQLV